jgi:hypothetical protein
MTNHITVHIQHPLHLGFQTPQSSTLHPVQSEGLQPQHEHHNTHTGNAIDKPLAKGDAQVGHTNCTSMTPSAVESRRL